MNNKFLFLILLLCFGVSKVYGLELDEKLTLRLLSVSASKKTILINRGIEDGLVVGDHAKLFLTTGVVGRALVIKVSPTRSIWSVYRLVNPQFIVSDRVLNLKIASPLKLTEDSSKALVIERRIPDGLENIKITQNTPMADVSTNSSQYEKTELMELKEETSYKTPMYTGNNHHKSWEVFGMMNLSSYGGTMDLDESTVDITDSSMDFSIGVEKYFWSQSGFLKDLSVFALFNSKTNSYSSSVGSSSSTTKQANNEFGAGINYYFFNSPFKYGKVLGYGSASFGVGSATSSTETDIAGTDDPEDLTGKSSFFTLGLGGKFFLRNQFGAIAMIDYSTLATTFEYEDSDSQVSQLSGIRLRFGLAYRF